MTTSTRAPSSPAAIARLALAASLAAACAPDGFDDPAGTARAAQFDTRSLGYLVEQGGRTVAAVWAGPLATGEVVEYWAASARYRPSQARAITGASQSCAEFKRAVCAGALRGAVVYRSSFTESRMDCTRPPAACRAPAGAVSFLGAGSYRTADAAGAPFATTHVEGACEYWAMTRTVSDGVSVQSPLAAPYASLAAFHAAACAASPAPATFYVATYLPVADFCATDAC